MPRLKKTWVVVMDGAHARFFSLNAADSGLLLEVARPPLTYALEGFARNERSDKPGRSFGAAGSSIRHTVEPRHDYHKLAKHAFTRSVADAIEKGVATRAFENLVVAAPRRTLGELRKLLAKNGQETIALEIAKNLVPYEPHELLTRIVPELENNGLFVAKRGTGAVPRRSSAADRVPVTILFRDLQPAESVEKSIRSQAKKLHKVFSRIQACKAVVEGSHAHHRKGRLYRVTVDARIAGHTVTARSTGSRGLAHDDVFAAIRAAFDSAGRRLQDYTGKRSARLQTGRSSSLQSRRADTL